MRLSKANGASQDSTAVGIVYEYLSRRLSTVTTQLKSGAIARATLSNENFNEVDKNNVASVAGTVEDQISSMFSDRDLKKVLNFENFTNQKEECIEAAVGAALISSDLRTYLNYEPPQLPVLKSNQVLVSMEGYPESFKTRSKAFEAFKDEDNRTAVINAVTYNFLAPRQDEANECLFPIFTVPVDHWGFGVTARVHSVMNQVRRGIAGDGKTFVKKNLLRAFVDPTILRMNSTEMIPVSRPETLKHLVSNSDITHVAQTAIEDVSFLTAPLKFGSQFNLIELSTHQALIDTGVLDSTDILEPNITLQNIYLKVVDNSNPAAVKTDVIKFAISSLPSASFVGAQQGQQNDLNFNMRTDSLVLHKDVKRVNGTALDALGSIVTGDYKIRLQVTISGHVNTEYGTCEMMVGKPSIHVFVDTNDIKQDTSAGVPKVIADLLTSAEFIGFDLKAYRSNDNHRQRGNIIDTQWFTQLYTLYKRGPISVLRPTNADSSTDTSDLSGLVTATQAYMNAQGITELFRFCNEMAHYKPILDDSGEGPATLGVSRYSLRPYFDQPDLIDISSMINSVSSHERNKDIREVLLNIIRYHVYKAYVQSEIQVAHNAYNGGNAPTPSVKIITDQTISRYLMIEGDTRTIGPDFNFELKTTPDIRFRGRMFITFGVDTPIVNGQPHPLQFGATAWKPEVPIVLPVIQRDGSTRKELTVQPCFRQFINVPIGIMLQFTGIPETSIMNISINANII